MPVLSLYINIHELPSTSKEAKALGSKYYCSARCRQGHRGIRYTSNGVCIDCQGARNRKNREGKEEQSNIKSLNLAEKLMEEKELSENIGEVWDE